MTRVYKLKVPNENMISRIISNDNLAHEIMVIDRKDKEFINTYMNKLEKPALYILVNRETNKLYIGQTEDSLTRLKNHETKEFWTEAIVFHSKMNTLSTTEVRWLEARTYEVVSHLGYFDLTENIQKPKYPPLKEDQDIELEPVFEEAKRYICAAGFDIFMKRKEYQEPVIEIPVQTENTWLICYDSKYFKVEDCFKKYGQIYWRHKAGLQNIHKGDIVYLYGSSPESAIRFKAEVIESQMPYSKKMDVEDEFLLSGDTNSDGKDEKYFLVKYLAETNSEALTHSAMMAAGVMGKRPTATRLSQEQFKNLQEYIEKHFSKQTEDVKEEKFMIFHQTLKQAGGLCKMTYYPNIKKFILNKGTNIVAESNESCGKGAMTLREAIINNKKLSKKEGELYTLLQDIELPLSLSSPSGASKICWGTSRPGPDDWQDEKGKKYPTEWWKNSEVI